MQFALVSHIHSERGRGMPRKLRLQFAGAVYRVISRGKYRAHVFAHDGTKAAFLKCVDEAVEKANWVVH